MQQTPKHILAQCTVTLDRPRELRLTMGALVKYEKQTGKSFFKKSGSPIESPADMIALMWACALDEDPACTVEIVERNITAEAMEAFALALSRGAKNSRGASHARMSCPSRN